MKKPLIIPPSAIPASLVTLLVASPAHAHVSANHHMGFAEGLAHFLLEPTHLPAMLALGLASAVAVLLLVGWRGERKQKRKH